MILFHGELVTWESELVTGGAKLHLHGPVASIQMIIVSDFFSKINILLPRWSVPAHKFQVYACLMMRFSFITGQLSGDMIDDLCL